MATTKITITVPEELAAHIREQVKAGEYESVSAYLTRAGELLRDFDPIDVLIASMIAESGMPGPEEKAWVDDALRKAEAARRDGESGQVA